MKQIVFHLQGMAYPIHKVWQYGFSLLGVLLLLKRLDRFRQTIRTSPAPTLSPTLRKGIPSVLLGAPFVTSCAIFLGGYAPGDSMQALGDALWLAVRVGIGTFLYCLFSIALWRAYHRPMAVSLFSQG